MAPNVTVGVKHARRVDLVIALAENVVNKVKRIVSQAVIVAPAEQKKVNVAVPQSLAILRTHVKISRS